MTLLVGGDEEVIVLDLLGTGVDTAVVVAIFMMIVSSGR